MAEKKVPLRSEIDEKDTWNLTDLFRDDDAWMAAYSEIRGYAGKIASYAGKISQSAGALLEYMKLQDEVSVKFERLYTYANCSSDVDTGNNFYQDMKSKAVSVMVDIMGASAFYEPELMSIPEDKMTAFFAEEPELETYRRPITKIRAGRDHILSPDAERVMALASEMQGSPDNIRSIFADADMRYPDVVEKDGTKHPLTDGTFVPLLQSEDRELRKTAFETYYSRLGEFRNSFATMLDAQFKSLNFEARARKYGSTLEAALSKTEVPVSVYHNLIEAVHGNLDKMYRYVQLRKKMLGVDELHMYDIYPPIISAASGNYPIDVCKETVLKALSVMGEDYTDLLKNGFSSRWIDVYQNVGKRSGAYSTGVGRPHPYVLLNHEGNLDSMFTLAHEMGHALHSYHSAMNQPVCCADYVIFVAEVASTCNEVLLMKYLLAHTEDKKERAYLINHYLDSFKGTVYRQTMFAEFELMMGEMCENGEALTADALCSKYLELNKLYFGPDMVSDEQIGLEWARIPHFYYDYYVFQYATGYSAAVALANRILTMGQPAVEDYKKFLRSGGSQDPISLLKIAGVDMSSPEPVNSALKLFGELVDELDKLSEEI